METGGRSDWSDHGEEERELLGRCRAYVIGSPDAPGGGYKDVIYFTPCGRWLRICSRAAYHPGRDFTALELAFRVDSGKVREILDKADWPHPVELEHTPVERDLELTEDFNEAVSGPPPGYQSRQESEDAVRSNPANPYLRSELRAFRERSASPIPEDTRQIPRTEMSIKRNSLIVLLRGWATAWPPSTQEASTTAEPTAPLVSPEDDVEFSESELLILAVIGDSPDRITIPQIYEKLKEANNTRSLSTIKNTTPNLKRGGLIENNDAPKFYGFKLTTEGRALISKFNRPV